MRTCTAVSPQSAVLVLTSRQDPMCPDDSRRALGTVSACSRAFGMHAVSSCGIRL